MVDLQFLWQDEGVFVIGIGVRRSSGCTCNEIMGPGLLEGRGVRMGQKQVMCEARRLKSRQVQHECTCVQTSHGKQI